MTTILVSGMNGNKLITQGYGTTTPSEGNKWIGQAVLQKKPRLAFLLACKQFLEAELNE